MRVRIYQVCAALAENLPLDKLTSRLDSRLEFATTSRLLPTPAPIHDTRCAMRDVRCAMCDARYRSLSSVLFWLACLVSPVSAGSGAGLGCIQRSSGSRAFAMASRTASLGLQR
jgi:hypothetical protein